MVTEVKREFKVLREIISPENVQVMAELITIKQTKTLIGYIGSDAITAHEKGLRPERDRNNRSKHSLHRLCA